MKIHCAVVAFFLLFFQNTLLAQEFNSYKWEFGLDLTPIIAMPYAEDASGLGFELIVRRQLNDRIKLRLRYEVTQESNGSTPENKYNFHNTPIDPAPDGSPRVIANVHYLKNNQAIFLGWQKGFSVQGIKMYWGTDLSGQINAGEVWSEVLLEGQLPFDPFASPLIQQEAFTGVVNTYHNFQVGITPFLGIDIPLGERFNFMLETGPKLGFLWAQIPYISDFEQLDYRKSKDFFIQAFPLKDIAVAFKF